jgi:FkbM family methyltransferase
MKSCIFTNDNNVNVILPNHNFSNAFSTRDHHEILFRRINTFLINNNIIKNNFIDLGAWIGDNTIPWAKNIDGVIYSIDPSEANCNFIKEICKINDISNVKVIQYAISDKNEILSTNHDINHCSFVQNEVGIDGKNKVNAVSLDYLYEQKEIENIGYIHLDVEGMEYRVIIGSNNLIDTNRPIISFEQHLEIDNYDDILIYLNNKKYKVFLINETLPGCRHDCRNSMAFPEEIYSDQLVKDINKYIGFDVLIPK